MEREPGPSGTSIDGFVRTHARSLFGTAYLLCGDADAAEELVQDTLAALVPKWDRIDHADAPLAYVRRALVHRHVDARRRFRGRTVRLEDVAGLVAPDDRAERMDVRDTLDRLLRQLPSRQRAALVLKYLYDWPDAEIAGAIGCRPATVRTLTRRALLALRRIADRSSGPPTSADAGSLNAEETRHD